MVGAEEERSGSPLPDIYRKGMLIEMNGSLGKDRGIIYNIQRFSIHDGNGIRTIFFMKGCPLKCIWCCNPESQSIEQEVLFLRDKCIGCFNCIRACPYNAMEIERDKCRKCGACSNVCPANAKRISGQYITVDDVIREAEKDRLFYRNSGGGITFSGGEPLLQHEFVSAVAQKLHYLDIHTAIETCGFAPWRNMEQVLSHIDEIFMDLKHMDTEKHKALTGVGNELILENAKKAAALGKRTTFRIPLVPGCNDEEENIVATAEFVKSMTSDDVFFEILPYHRLGEMKFEWLDRVYELEGAETPPDDVVAHYNDIFKEAGCNVIQKGVLL